MKRAILGAALIVALSALWVMPAGATTTCQLSSGVLSVSVDLSFDEEGGFLIVYLTETGDIVVMEYLFSTGEQPVACTGSPTSSNTEAIAVTGTDKFDAMLTHLIIGGTSETGDSEIEVSTNDIDLLGTSGDSQTAGTSGIRLNHDDDVDLTYGNAQQLQLAAVGPGVLSAAGDGVVGDPLQIPAALFGSDGSDRLLGGDNDDYLFGGSGNDFLYGGPGHDYHGDLPDAEIFEEGNDTFQESAGSDVFAGGVGRDTMNFASSSERVIVTTGDGIANDGPVSDPGLVMGIENLIGSPFNDVLKTNVAGPVVNSLTGGAGNDQLLGYGGDDTLTGSGGDDRLTGAGGKDRLTGSGGKDLLKGGDSADKLFGGDAADALYGEAGGDALDGGAASDLCDGGGGSDSAVRCEKRRAIASASPWSWTWSGDSAQTAEDLPRPMTYQMLFRVVMASSLGS